MLLRAAIVMLVMLNLGAAGWWWLQPAAVRAAPIRDSVATLRLLDESAPPPPAPQVQAPEPAVVAPSVPAATAPAKAVAEAPVVAVAPMCLRFGPFANGEARASAQARLADAGVQAALRDDPVRNPRGWNVYLPPQPSRAEALALADTLRAAGIGDLFVLDKGAQVNGIALGRFSSEAGARRRQAELQAKGVQARVEPVGGAPAALWLQAKLPAARERATLSAIAPASPLDCALLR